MNLDANVWMMAHIVVKAPYIRYILQCYARPKSMNGRRTLLVPGCTVLGLANLDMLSIRTTFILVELGA
jgi:hypothetical protein